MDSLTCVELLHAFYFLTEDVAYETYVHKMHTKCLKKEPHAGFDPATVAPSKNESHVVANLAEMLLPVTFVLAGCNRRRVKSGMRLFLSKIFSASHPGRPWESNFTFFSQLQES